MNNTYKNADEHIQSFPEDVQELLEQIRKTIKQAAADATESMSYGMPAYKLYGKPLVYFATFKNHIGLYATSRAHSAFTEELVKYKQGKGSVQFPLDKSMPLDLIAEIVKFKAKENLENFSRKH